jgi:hypothetical protein
MFSPLETIVSLYSPRGCRGGVGVVAGQAEPERGGEGMSQDAQHDVEVDVEVDRGG